MFLNDIINHGNKLLQFRFILFSTAILLQNMLPRFTTNYTFQEII